MSDLITETIGCDLGDRQSELFILRGSEETLVTVKTTRDGFTEFFTRPRAHVVIEVGTHSRWVSTLLRGLGHRVTVANPRRVHLISRSHKKSDTHDAELLARLGRADEELLSPIQHRSENAQTHLAVIRTRDVLVRARVKLINHIRGLVKSFGGRLPSSTTASFHRKAKTLVPEPLRLALDPLLAVLENIQAQLEELEARIEAVAQQYPDVRVIGQPKGVGTLTALAFLLTLEDKTRFTKSRMVGPFLGLSPSRDQSGALDKQLGISKTGDSYLRRLVVNCANHILGPFGQDSDLRRWGLRLAARGGVNARKRAKVAVARKLAVLMHRLWVTGEVYQPLGYAEKKNAA